MKMIITYRKGNIYQHVDNSDYIITDEYEAEQITERILNPKTEKYEYKTRLVNHKLDWEQGKPLFRKKLSKKLKEKKMKGIYLAAHIADHPNYNIDYQDINGKRDIGGDMLKIDLSNYDYIIATPPCNYWSRANYRRDTSKYALETKHLLPAILDKLKKLNKPYIVENVKNSKLFNKYDIYNKADYVYEIGRHTYFTNIPFNASNIRFKSNNIQNKSTKNRQGGKQVYTIIETWLDIITQS